MLQLVYLTSQLLLIPDPKSFPCGAQIVTVLEAVYAAHSPHALEAVRVNGADSAGGCGGTGMSRVIAIVS